MMRVRRCVSRSMRVYTDACLPTRISAMRVCQSVFSAARISAVRIGVRNSNSVVRDAVFQDASLCDAGLPMQVFEFDSDRVVGYEHSMRDACF